MDLHKRDSKVKDQRFAPIPQRALVDVRVTITHMRVLGVIAAHDRLGRNGQGCWLARKELAALCLLDVTNLSHALSDLRRWGYITSETHPTDERKKIHRVLYTLADNDALVPASRKNRCDTTHLNRCATTHPSEQNRCDEGGRKVCQTPEIGVSVHNYPTEHKGEPDPIIIDYKIRPKKMKDVGKELDCAEARTTEKARKHLEETEAYLSEVQSLQSNPIIKSECVKLAGIADDDSLPDEVRSLAAALRDVARVAA